MPKYIPMYGKLTPASIPQVVAYIQDYLRDNPIPTVDAMAQLIAEFLADHPELVAVASVNSKTGEVVLTGADIMINSSNNVSIATQIININTAIAEHLARIVTAEQKIETLQNDYTNLNSYTSGLADYVHVIYGDVYNVRQNIRTLEDKTATLEEKTANNESSITEINNTLASHNQSINQNTTNYNLLNQEVYRLKETTFVDLSYTFNELDGYFVPVTPEITVAVRSVDGGSINRAGNVVVGRLNLTITGEPDDDGWYKFRLIVPVPQAKFITINGILSIDTYDKAGGSEYNQFTGAFGCGFTGDFKTKNKNPHITFILVVK